MIRITTAIGIAAVLTGAICIPIIASNVNFAMSQPATFETPTPSPTPTPTPVPSPTPKPVSGGPTHLPQVVNTASPDMSQYYVAPPTPAAQNYQPWSYSATPPVVTTNPTPPANCVGASGVCY